MVLRKISVLLTDHEIARWAKAGGITPFREEHLHPNSIDITIGNELMVEQPLARGGSRMIPVDLRGYAEHDPYLLQPSGFALILGAERIHLGERFVTATAEDRWINVVAKGKSGRAREGLDILNAGFAEVGYQGNLTLAVKNQLQYDDQLLWPGKRFAQLLLYTSDEPTSLYSGHYQGDSRVQASRGHFTTNT